MVSFDDRPIIHVIPFYRPSAYDVLFWHPDDFAEFKREAYMEKEEELLAENDDTPTPTTRELPVPVPVPVNQRLVQVVVDKEEPVTPAVFPLSHRRVYDRFQMRMHRGQVQQALGPLSKLRIIAALRRACLFPS